MHKYMAIKSVWLLGGRFADLYLPPNTLWVKLCSADSATQVKDISSAPAAPSAFCIGSDRQRCSWAAGLQT